MPTVTSPTAMKIRIVPFPMRLASLVAGVPQGVILVTWTVQVHAAVVKPGRARRCCRTATFSGAGRRAGTGRRLRALPRARRPDPEIGRATCGERGCQYV